MLRIINARAGLRLALMVLALVLVSANVYAEISRGALTLLVLDQDGKESHFTVRMGISGFNPATPPQIRLARSVPGLEVLSLSLRPSRQKSEAATLECECIYSGAADFIFPDLWLDIGGKRFTLRGERVTRAKLGLPQPSVKPAPSGKPTARAEGKKKKAQAVPAPSAKPVSTASPSVAPQNAQNFSVSGDRLRVAVGTRFYAVPDARSVKFEISSEEVEVKIQKRLSLEKATEWLLVRLPNGEKAWILVNKAKKKR
jgi:hypothetical protein